VKKRLSWNFRFFVVFDNYIGLTGRWQQQRSLIIGLTLISCCVQAHSYYSLARYPWFRHKPRSCYTEIKKNLARTVGRGRVWSHSQTHPRGYPHRPDSIPIPISHSHLLGACGSDIWSDGVHRFSNLHFSLRPYPLFYGGGQYRDRHGIVKKAFSFGETLRILVVYCVCAYIGLANKANLSLPLDAQELKIFQFQRELTPWLPTWGGDSAQPVPFWPHFSLRSAAPVHARLKWGS